MSTPLAVTGILHAYPEFCTSYSQKYFVRRLKALAPLQGKLFGFHLHLQQTPSSHSPAARRGAWKMPAFQFFRSFHIPPGISRRQERHTFKYGKRTHSLCLRARGTFTHPIRYWPGEPPHRCRRRLRHPRLRTQRSSISVFRPDQPHVEAFRSFLPSKVCRNDQDLR